MRSVAEEPADERWMRRALQLAGDAEREGEVPVGAVVVAPGGATFEAYNRTRGLADPTAHAEVLALRRAAKAAGDWRLTGHTIYVTLEPCAMCAGAIVLARLDRLVFGAADPKAGMCGSLSNLVQDERLNHRVELSGGVLAEEAGRLLRGFFRERRS
jgi:tRNA(adenine34) deaminase